MLANNLADSTAKKVLGWKKKPPFHPEKKWKVQTKLSYPY